MSYVEMADLSHWESDLNWVLIPEDIKAVVLKATEGATWVDPSFETFRKKCVDFGRGRAAYHFFHPAIDPVLQANHYCDIAGDIHSVAWCDVEVFENVYGDALAYRIFRFLERVEERTGITPGIYTRKNIWDIYIAPYWKYSYRYHNWIAQYIGYPFLWPLSPNTMVGWSGHWDMWQYSDRKIIGTTSCDANRFNGTRNDMVTFPFEFPINKETIMYPQLPVGVVICDSLNIRSGAGTGFSLVGGVKRGESFEIIREVRIGDDIWVQIGYHQYCAMLYRGARYISIS